MARQGWAQRGVAEQGMAWRSKAWYGAARQGNLAMEFGAQAPFCIAFFSYQGYFSARRILYGEEATRPPRE